MAENLLQELWSAKGELATQIENLDIRLEGRLVVLGESIAKLHDRMENLENQLDRIEAFLGMPKAEVEPSKETKTDPARFRIKGSDGNEVYWYGGRNKGKEIWHKSDKLAKKFKSPSKAEEIVEGFDSNVYVIVVEQVP